MEIEDLETNVKTPRLVSAEVAAEMCGISLRAWRRLDATGRVPKPVMLGPRLKRWSEQELTAWITAGCPSRRAWESKNKEEDQ